MSLINVPFVGTGVDTALHVVSTLVLVGSISAAVYGFWKLHEIPIHKAHSSGHHQIGLITILTWIGFIWHWVWVLAIIIAFVDLEQSVIRLREIWKGNSSAESKEESC
ncbi:permease [Vibrio ishigakensis]|uniref:Permease n=1 Tax=Vibrio ishigakensis TaxID=1481914 RepID=A0A0B8NRN3_9VIBR|nr:MFS transporter [Vibrio ishigakensis]GAM54917.1 permease [Vibrio ishigakensis]GAM71066.1 permease of the major facilitator superfamily [Vibrio sp. JCM 19236]